jgi:hypothetical protein
MFEMDINVNKVKAVGCFISISSIFVIIECKILKGHCDRLFK